MAVLTYFWPIFVKLDLNILLALTGLAGNPPGLPQWAGGASGTAVILYS